MPRLARRTIRVRLTVLYGVLFLISAAALLVMTYAFVAQQPDTVERHATASPGDQLPSLPSLAEQAAQQREADLQRLLVGSVSALAVMAVVSLGLGWLLAGRVLRPLRTITATARRISASNLHRRLALPGPADEVKDLGDTFDALLARLEGAFDAQRRFVANASHELRTPLTLVHAHLDAALTDPTPTHDSWRTACQQALAAAVRQEQLIDALLTLARSEGGLEHRRAVDLAQITGQALRTLQAEDHHPGVRLTATLDPALISGDPRLIERLVTNLIDNAVRHNSSPGWVEVYTGESHGHPTLSVTNGGRPIDAADIHRLFQPFQRGGENHTGHHGGVGLGLSIVDAIATAHDAHIQARPRDGGGLDLTVTFPSQASGSIRDDSSRHNPESQPRPRIDERGRAPANGGVSESP